MPDINTADLTRTFHLSCGCDVVFSTDVLPEDKMLAVLASSVGSHSCGSPPPARIWSPEDEQTHWCNRCKANKLFREWMLLELPQPVGLEKGRPLPALRLKWIHQPCDWGDTVPKKV